MAEKLSLTGNQLWAIRTELEISQSKFGNHVGLNQVQLHRMEERGSEDLVRPDPNESLRNAIRFAKKRGIKVPSAKEADQRRADFDSRQATSGAVEAAE